jgi:hypothetical protein
VIERVRRRHAHALERVQRREQQDALRLGWLNVERPLAEAAAQRRRHLGRAMGEVALGHRAAGALDREGDRGGEGPLVKRRGALLGDAAQRLGEGPLHETVARSEAHQLPLHGAAREKAPALLVAGGKEVGVDANAGLGNLNGRLEGAGEAQAPSLSASFSHRSTRPGTVTEAPPVLAAWVAARGEGPEPLTATTGCPSRLSRTNPSPPRPQASGDTTPSTAWAAIMASTALPPWASRRCPAAAARGWAAATAPRRPASAGRWGRRRG